MTIFSFASTKCLGAVRLPAAHQSHIPEEEMPSFSGSQQGVLQSVHCSHGAHVHARGGQGLGAGCTEARVWDSYDLRCPLKKKSQYHQYI